MTFSLISVYQQGDLQIGLMILRIAGTFILAGLFGGHLCPDLVGGPEICFRSLWYS